jgi:hypothetical protein
MMVSSSHYGHSPHQTDSGIGIPPPEHTQAFAASYRSRYNALMLEHHRKMFFDREGML